MSREGTRMHSSEPRATDNLTCSTTLPLFESPASDRHLSSQATTCEQPQHDSDLVQKDTMLDTSSSFGASTTLIQQHTFFQRYLTKPTEPSPSDPEKRSQPPTRHFSFLSLGSLVSAAVMFFVLLGIIAAALALTLDREHHKTKTDVGHFLSPIHLGISSNFPDPALWFENGTWYAYATNNAAGVNNRRGEEWRARNNTKDFGRANIQLATSRDFINWSMVDLADQPLPTTGDWTGTHMKNETKLSFPKVSSTWSPSVIKNDRGEYVLYYSSAHGSRNPYASWPAHHSVPHCIGAAVSTSPLGPFIPQNTSLACPISAGGAIDPSAIRDADGTLYLTYKIDGNNIGSGGECGNTIPPIRPTPIVLQKMSSDGLTPTQNPLVILENVEEDGPLIEAPMLVRSPAGVYFLFFSSGCTRFSSYTTKYATATSIEGPYTRHEGALLATGDFGLEAPGSVGIAEDGEGGFSMAFHARVQYGEVGGVRAMFTTKLNFTGHDVTLIRRNSTGDQENRQG